MSTPAKVSTPAKIIPGVDRVHDGARILWRHFLSTRKSSEGWVKEFTRDGTQVRISRTEDPGDAGLWHRTYDLVVEAVLDSAKAPPTKDGSDDLNFGGGA